MMRFAHFATIAFALFLALQVQASGQVSEIGLYPPDLRAIRQMAGPSGDLSVPSGVDSAKAARAWARISKKGREFLLRDPGLALVIVNSDGRWLYRSTGIAALRSLYEPRETLRKQDADDLAEVLDSPLCRQLRDFYEGLLFSAGPYSTNGTRGMDSPIAEAYGSLLSRVEGGRATREEKDWFRRVVGFEILGLDEKTRQVLRTDPTYGTEIVKAIEAADEIRKQEFHAVAQAFVYSGLHPHSEHSVNIDDLAFHLPERPGEATVLGTIEMREVNGKRVLTWTNPAGTVFVGGKRKEVNLPFDFTKENLRALLQADKVEMYVSSPTSPNIFEVRAAGSPKKQ